MAKNKELSRLVNKIKDEKNLTQKEIASKLGVTDTYFSGVLNNHYELTDKLVSKIHEVFHINLNSAPEILTSLNENGEKYDSKTRDRVDVLIDTIKGLNETINGLNKRLDEKQQMINYLKERLSSFTDGQEDVSKYAG